MVSGANVQWLFILCAYLGFRFATTRGNESPPPPLSPRAEAVSPFDIEVTWDGPKDDRILGYSVKINVYSRPNSFFYKSFGADDDMTFTKSDLLPNTTYEVTITSKNSQLETTSVRLLVRTPPSLVPKRPRGFEGRYVSKDMIRYRWSYADAEDKIVGYYLIVRNNFTNETREVVIPPYRHAYILSQLEPGTVYELFLAAVNLNGTGPSSRSVFTTREYTPSKPSIIFIQPVDSTAVYVKWRPEDNDRNTGFIRGYHVFYQELEDNETAHSIDTQSAVSTEILITDLKPDTQYYVVVSGYTSSSRGINSDKEVVRTKRKDFCMDRLRVESADFPDSSTTASPYFSDNVIQVKGRIRTEVGEWCSSQISPENYEYLLINLDQPKKVTMVEIQTNSEKEKGPEYARGFQLEYQDVNSGDWRRYKPREVNEVLFGDPITEPTGIIELTQPIISSQLRLIPYGAMPKVLCMQVEVYGCRLQVELPKQPVDLQAVAVSDTEAEITWTPAAEGDFINSFVMTVTENGKIVIPETIMASNSSGLPLNYLRPGSTYIFKLAGQNEWGTGAEAAVRLKMPNEGERPWLYFTNHYVIRKLKIDTRHEEVLLPTNNPISIALDVDYELDLMFYSTNPNEDIYSMNIKPKDELDDGTVLGVKAVDKTCNLRFNESSVEQKLVVSVFEGQFTVDSLAVDWLYKNIYWTVKGANKISVASYNGKYRKILIDDGLIEPTAIALDPENGLMYWAEQGKGAKIRRSGMDGKLMETIVERKDGLRAPNDLCIDFVEKRIYWTDSKIRSIASANLDGSDIRKVVAGRNNVGFPASITVLDDYLYFSDLSSKSIKSLNKITRGNLTTVTKRRYAVTDMVLYHAKKQSSAFSPKAKMLCEIAQCDHLCLPTPRYSENVSQMVSCSCSDGYILVDMKHCIDETSFGVLEEALSEFKKL